MISLLALEVLGGVMGMVVHQYFYERRIFYSSHRQMPEGAFHGLFSAAGVATLLLANGQSWPGLVIGFGIGLIEGPALLLWRLKVWPKLRRRK
jgi:hypothetical protein